MDKKRSIRKRYILKRQNNYFEIKENFFFPLIKLIKSKFQNKKLLISLYYPNSYELNILKIFNQEKLRKHTFLLPVIEKDIFMSFHEWKKQDILNLNKYGIPEPIKYKKRTPHVILVPLVAYDKFKNRLGYGKGFYDKYLKKYLNMPNKILKVGIAFSFQKYHNLPSTRNDVKLDHIITEKGII